MEESDNNEEFVDNEEPFIDDSEDKELVDDSCSTKVVGSVEPQDTFNLVYILFYFFGITSLMPWNFLMTANDYWMYKFRDTTPRNGSVHLGKTQFQAEFTSYLNVATALPNMLFLILNSLYGHHISVNIRIGGSLLIVTLSFLVTTAFVQVDTDNWQQDFFFITILIVVIMTAASAIVCGGICGIAGRFSAKYMTAVVSGQALGGIVAAVAQTLSLAFKVSPLHSALIYFVIGDIMLIVSLLSYFTLSSINFYTYHMKKGYSGMASNRNRVVSYRAVIKKTWKYTFSMFMIFTVSTSVYPAVTVLIESHHSDKGTDWNNIYFVPVVNYLMFNCSDYAGRIIAGLVQRPASKAWVVSWGSVLRVLGIPLLMLCNAQPRKHLPVLIGSDWEYIIIMMVFGISNGYLTNITFINCPKSVEPHEKEKASSILAAVLSIGVTAGAALSMALVKIL